LGQSGFTFRGEYTSICIFKPHATTKWGIKNILTGNIPDSPIGSNIIRNKTAYYFTQNLIFKNTNLT